LFGKAIWSSSGPGQWLAHVDAILYDTKRLEAADDMLVCSDYEQFTATTRTLGSWCVSLEKKLRTLRQAEVAQSESLVPSHLVAFQTMAFLHTLSTKRYNYGLPMCS
jgi:hypothetical protein